MSCELIRIDFGTKAIKSRTQLKEAEYDPSKCEHFASIMDHAKEMAIDAFKAGVDPKRIVVILSDPNQNFSHLFYDPAVQDMTVVADSLDHMTTKLVRLINEAED